MANNRPRSILRAHGYTRRHIKAWRSGLIEFHEYLGIAMPCGDTMSINRMTYDMPSSPL